ncbi:MAG: hypothetical protein WCO42_02835 [bacterium]
MIVSKSLLAGVCVGVVGGLALPVLAANVITLKNGRVISAPTIEWRSSTGDYIVAAEGGAVPIPLAQVARLNIERPAEFDQAIGLVKSRLFRQAVPLLEGIVSKYKMLNWDVDAGKWLVQCYLEINDPKKLATAMDALVAAGGTVPNNTLMMYWKMLQKAGDVKRLNREITRTLGTGSPDFVATAYMMRGNAYLKDGDEASALADFLKVVTLFKNEKAVQPEALFTAADLLDKAKDPRGADLRKVLMQEYKNSEYATKAAAVK